MTVFRREIRDLEVVKRWGVVRTLFEQNVASHSFFVAIYSQLIAELVKVPSKEMGDLMISALWHDMPEIATGDMIGPAKHHALDPTRLRQFERAAMMDRFGRDLSDIGTNKWNAHRNIIKAADCLDQLLYLCIEQQMGNGSVEMYKQQALIRAKTAWLMLPDNYVYSVNLESLWQEHVIPAVLSHESGQSHPILYPGISEESLSLST